MDKIWDRKSFEDGGHWPLLRGWKKRMTKQNRQKSKAKKNKKSLSTGFVFQEHTWINCSTKDNKHSIEHKITFNPSKGNTCPTCVKEVSFNLIGGSFPNSSNQDSTASTTCVLSVWSNQLSYVNIVISQFMFITRKKNQ